LILFHSLIDGSLFQRFSTEPIVSGASPTKRDFGRGLNAAQWSHYCGRHVCAESIEKFVRTALPGGNSSSGGTAGPNVKNF
jgi:hypothetical protein